MEATSIFLRNTFLTLYVIVFVISIIRFPLYKKTPLKYLPLILFSTIGAEYGALIFKDQLIDIIYVFHNIYYLIHFSFFFYIFMEIIEDAKFKKYIKIGIGVFWLFYLSDLIFTRILDDYFVTAYIAGAGILVFCILLYYINILQSSLVLVIKNDLLFWVSVGLFLFYIGYIPIKILRSWWFDENLQFFNVLLVIQFSLIILMYLFFLAGFLWMKKR